MTSQDLADSSANCNNYIYFSFEAEFFDVDIVTSTLHLEPTAVRIKQHPAPKSTAWIYRVDAGEDFDLEIHLEKLIDIFNSKVVEINRLKEQLSIETLLQFVIDIDIRPDSSTPYFGLNKRTINFLSKTNTEVDFDLYKIGRIGLADDLIEE
jgi:hypothetical protein